VATWRVLLVDPIADDREIQELTLRHAGLAVIEPRENPFREAVRLKPDAVVVDVPPSRPGAVEFVRALKEDPRTATIPVVVVSGYPRSEIQVPIEGFVGKPCAAEKIVAEVARVVTRT
jgi:response regulator RpfG family c-di-GMP phosphodiesterase